MECISLCAWHVLFLYFVSQCMHSCIEPSLHGVDFCLEIFLWRLSNTNLHCVQKDNCIESSSIYMQWNLQKLLGQFQVSTLWRSPDFRITCMQIQHLHVIWTTMNPDDEGVLISKVQISEVPLYNYSYQIYQCCFQRILLPNQ